MSGVLQSLDGLLRIVEELEVQDGNAGCGGGSGGAAGFFDDCLSLGCSALQTCGSGRRASAPALGTTDLKKRSVFVFCVCAAHKHGHKHHQDYSNDSS